MRDVDDDEQEIWQLPESEFRLRFRSLVCGVAHAFFPSCMSPSHLLRLTTERISARYISNESIARLKRSNHESQNLSERYKRLEQSLRGNESRLSEIDDRSTSSYSVTISKSKSKPSQRVYHGLIVPEAPKPPEPDGMHCFSVHVTNSCWQLTDFLCRDRMLHVRLCYMCSRPLSRITRRV